MEDSPSILHMNRQIDGHKHADRKIDRLKEMG